MKCSRSLSAPPLALLILVVAGCGLAHTSSLTFTAPYPKSKVSTRDATIVDVLPVIIAGMPSPAAASNWVSPENDDLWPVRIILFGILAITMFFFTEVRHANAFFRNLQAEREAALKRENEQKQRIAALGFLGIGAVALGIQAFPMAYDHIGDTQKIPPTAEVGREISQPGAKGYVHADHAVQTAMSLKKAQELRDAKVQKFQHSEEAQKRHKLLAIEEAKKAEAARRQAEAEAAESTNPLEDLMKLGLVCAAFVTVAEKKVEPDSKSKHKAADERRFDVNVVEEPVAVGP